MQKTKAHAQLSSPPLLSTTWSGGFWLNQFKLATDTILPNIYHLFDSDGISHNLANFRIAAGLQEGEHAGPSFGDGDFYKWLEAASYAYGVTKDKKLKAIIDESVKLIKRVQREDGYIFTPYSIKLLHGQSEEKLGNSLNFEAYNLGHLITAGCVHFSATGEETLLSFGKKAASCLKGLFEVAQKTNTAKTAICPSHYMALIDLYRTTGDEQYLRTAELAIKLRDQVVGGTDDNQDRLKLAEHQEMTGHAVRATYLYSGVADLYAELGGEDLKAMLLRVWESEEYTKMYINSGCGALYDGVSPSGYAGDHPNLQRTHQAFGRPYQLPNLTAYNETCATVGNIFFNWRLLKLTTDPIHADRVEQSFYNLILASVNLGGKKYFYANPLERESKPLPFHLKWERSRSEYLSSFCCPPNMLRILTESSEYAYALGENSVYTGIYGESNTTLPLGDNLITLEQRTAYPYKGTITIRYASEKPVEFTLQVRIPSWVKRGTLLDDQTFQTLSETDANTYIPIHRMWTRGDEVKIEFDMTPRMVLAHPLIEESKHQVAVMKGPLLYCSEEIDHKGDYFASIGLKPTATFVEDTILMEGQNIPCLKTKDALSYPDLQWKRKQLYHDASALSPQPCRAILIPYFAWDNRGLGGMKIWHPLYI